MEISKEVHEIELREIRPSESNVRKTDKGARLGDLMESIKKHGLLQPVILRGSHGNPPYELIVGQRRFRAHQELGRRTIKAVFAGDLGDIEAKILSLTENVQRLELNRADQAEAITELYMRYDRNTQRVARELGLSRSTVRDYVKVEELATPKAKRLLREKSIRKEDVKRVIDAAQGDPEKADELLDELPKLSRYEKDRAVEYGKSHPEAAAREITEYSRKPQYEFAIILKLPKEVDEALDEAKEAYAMDKELVAVKAISEWLEDKGFLRLEAQEVSET